MRADALHRKEGRFVDFRLVDLARVLRYEFADHFEMAELFHRDILQHVADACVLDMEGLYPILQSRSQFSGCTAELFEQKLAELGIWLADINRHDGFFNMGKHRIDPFRA